MKPRSRALCSAEAVMALATPRRRCSGLHRHVLQLRRVGQRQVSMAERLVVLPRHQVEAISLVEAGEAQDRRNALDLVVVEGTDDERLGLQFDGETLLSCRLPNDNGWTPGCGRHGTSLRAFTAVARHNLAETKPARLRTPIVFWRDQFSSSKGET